MSRITQKSTIAEVGAIVCEALKQAGLDVFLSGGAVVSIYTDNRYESYDLDFVTLADRSKVKRVMESLGFKQDKSRLFVHPESKYYVEFPGAAVKVGEELITAFGELRLPVGTLCLLTPTDSVKDRLAAYIHWKDKQGLDQAIWIAAAKKIDLRSIEVWAHAEGGSRAFKEFKDRLALAKTKEKK